MPIRRLPVRPNLDQLKHQAKDLLRAIRRGDPQALEDLKAFRIRDRRSSLTRNSCWRGAARRRAGRGSCSPAGSVQEIYPPDLGCHDEVLATHGTPLAGATLLHMCVDYGELDIARWLLDRGMDPDATAAVDADGFGGHTALFATVVSQPNFWMNYGKRPHVAPPYRPTQDRTDLHAADPAGAGAPRGPRPGDWHGA